MITSDVIILNKCKSWFNLTKIVIEDEIEDFLYIDLSFDTEKSI